MTAPTISPVETPTDDDSLAHCYCRPCYERLGAEDCIAYCGRKGYTEVPAGTPRCVVCEEAWAARTWPCPTCGVIWP